MKISKAVVGVLAAGAALTLTGCSATDDPASLKTYCKGPDKVFVLDDDQSGTGLFIVPSHADCKGNGS